MNSIEKQRKHFNSVAKKYLEGKKNKNFLTLQSLIWKEVYPLLPKEIKEKEINVLEPMCGYTEGLNILNSFNLDIKYSGFDYSEEIVDFLNKTSPKLKVFHGDVTQIDINEKYDLIILIGGLHHVPNFASDVVKNLAQRLNPAGVFINLEPTHGNKLSKYIRNYVYRNNEIFDYDTERDFSVEEVSSFFESAGLANIATIYPGLLAYVLYYNPYAFPKLNLGTEKTVESVFNLERSFYKGWIGKTFSFCTLSIWRKNDLRA